MEGVAVDQIGRFGPHQASEAAIRLARDGVIVFERLFDPAVVLSIADHVRRRVPGAYDPDAPRPEDYLSVGTKRMNGLVPIDRSMAPAIDMLLNPALDILFSAALGRDWVYESFGVISSFPGATTQGYHADDAHLFPGSAFAGSLPAYALTISIPLVEVNGINGGTEFLLGTHLSSTGEGANDTPVTSPLLPGDCMIWDYMVRHRGQANNSDKARPMLDLTACRSFWSDSKNFRPDARKLVIERDLVWSLPAAGRKRLKRFKPLPGLGTGLRSISRVIGWYAPRLHQGLLKLLRRPGSLR